MHVYATCKVERFRGQVESWLNHSNTSLGFANDVCGLQNNTPRGNFLSSSQVHKNRFDFCVMQVLNSSLGAENNSLQFYFQTVYFKTCNSNITRYRQFDSYRINKKAARMQQRHFSCATSLKKQPDLATLLPLHNVWDAVVATTHGRNSCSLNLLQSELIRHFCRARINFFFFRLYYVCLYTTSAIARGC